MIEKMETTDLHDQAAEWFQRFEAGKATADHKAFRAWLAEDEAHYAAFSDMGPLTTNFSILGEDIRRLGRDDTPFAIDFQKTARMVAVHRAQTHGSHNLTWRHMLGVAASFLIMLTGITAWKTGFFTPVVQVHQTAAGEQKTLLLADGSVITLNTGSRITVALTESVRRLHLQAGEVYFQVAKDPSRPFEVAVRNGFVKALGTEFNIRHRGDQVSVTVMEGKVQVTPSPVHNTPRKFELLTLGDQLVFGAEVVERSTLGTVDLNRMILWREGKIILDNKSLAEVIEQIRPYIPQKIIIADKSIAAMTTGGVLEIGNVEGFFTALELALPVKVVREKGVIILTATDEEALRDIADGM
ncbi:MAG: FecR domain-containing protein [Spongiibacteraceae bacterium]|nr:FecR domain-containing protein [Spongiibacteraceae bacterium]